MSDWQVGDRAVCVLLDVAPPRLVLGRVYTVVDINDDWADTEGVGLCLAEVAPQRRYDGFHEGHFRKIRPDEHKACEAEFVTLLRRSKVNA